MKEETSVPAAMFFSAILALAPFLCLGQPSEAARGSSAPYVRIVYPADDGMYAVNTSIRFIAYARDLDGSIQNYNWSIYRIGQYWGGNASGSNEYEPFFAEDGEYDINLTVTDNDNLTSSSTLHFWIVSTPHKPPVPVITSPIDNATVDGGGQYILNGSGSYDPNGIGIAHYYWFHPESGRITTSLPKDESVTAPEQAGQYTVILTVEGEGGVRGLRNWTTARINVINGIINTPPVAVISVPNDCGTFPVNTSVHFSSEESYDPEGDMLHFEWVVSGHFVGNETNITQAFGSPGDYTVSLTVSDGRLKSAANLTVHISAGMQTMVRVPDGNGNASFQEGVLAVTGGKGMTLEGVEPTGPNPLVHRWDFGDGTTATGRTVNHTYARSGSYVITYTVSDGDAAATITVKVDVKAGQSSQMPAPPVTAYALAGGLVLLCVGFAFFLGGTELGLGLLAPLLVFLYSKIRHDEILDNFYRGRISGYIVANPGDHYNSIRDALKLSNGNLAFHLRKLQDEGVIKSRVEGTYRRFYPSEMRVPEPDGGSLTQVQKMVFDKIQETPGISQKDISGVLNISTQTVGYHIEALFRKGVIRKERAGMKIRLFVEETAFSGANGHGGGTSFPVKHGSR